MPEPRRSGKPGGTGRQLLALGANGPDITEQIDPADVQRELTEAIERTDSLGQAIEAVLAEAERELEDIRRIGTPHQPVIPALVAGIQRSPNAETS